MFTQIKLWALGAFGLLAAFAAAFMKGRQSQANREAKEALQNYTDTRERIDEAVNTKRDPDDAREWLRNRNK